MIPTPQRVRATRRWAMQFAAVIALPLLVILVAAMPTAIGITIAIGLSGLTALGIYRSETRIVRRRLAVMARAFPAAWDAILMDRIPYFAALRPEAQQRFRQLVALFLEEKPIIGIGCRVDDTTRLMVAASAIIPIFAFPAWEYGTLRKVLIRPEPFDATFQAPHANPTVALGMVGAAGLFNGVMILSKPDLYAGFAEGAGKHHVGIHEFAHLVDHADGAIDGVPAPLPRTCLQPWTTLVHDHLSQIAGSTAGIPAYGYTNEAEFFAVVSEYFFQMPDELAQRDPPLYDLLQRIYGQDLRRSSTPAVVG